MKDIRVRADGKKFKILINFIQRAAYQSQSIANHLAQEIQQKEFPGYTLTLHSWDNKWDI